MGFILDTSVLIEVENGNEEVIQEIIRLKEAANVELLITIFNFCEFYYGILLKNEKYREKALSRLRQYALLQTTERSAQIFCELQSEMKRKGRGIAQFDLFIASLAIEFNHTLLTLDSDFEQVPKLKKIILKRR